MAFTWEIENIGSETLKGFSELYDCVITGAGTLSAAGISNSPAIPAKPFGSVQVLRTSGDLTGIIESSNDGTNFATGYDVFGVVRPALFTSLSASRNFDEPEFPAYRQNRLKLTAGASGFSGSVIIYCTRRS